jgi:hypothetical protein
MGYAPFLCQQLPHSLSRISGETAHEASINLAIVFPAAAKVLDTK